MPKSVTHHCWGWNRVVEMQAWLSVYPFHDYKHSEGWCHQTAAPVHLHKLLSWFRGDCGRGANDSVGTALLEDNTCSVQEAHLGSAPAPCLRPPWKAFSKAPLPPAQWGKVSWSACRGLVRIQWDYLGENCLYFGMKSSWVLSNLVWREIQGRIQKFKRGLNWWDVHMCSGVTCLKDNWLELSSLLVQMC